MSSAAAEVSSAAGPQGTLGAEGTATVQQPASDMATRLSLPRSLYQLYGLPSPLQLL